MKKILLIPDSFKGTMSSLEICSIMEAGIHRHYPEAEVVSIPADRFCGSTKKIDKCFLGKNAPLPYGPFSIATMHALDVVAVNVMKTSTKQYTIYITPLLYNKEASRKAQIEELADAYIKELERMLRLFPAQWYNYFDFWNKDE